MILQVTGQGAVHVPTLAADAAEEAAQSYGNKVTNLITTVQRTQPESGKCVWHLGTVIGLGQAERAALAWLIADAIMSDRAGYSNAADVWRDAALRGETLTGRDRQQVEAFIAAVFGLPPEGKSETHVIGHIAEWLWYLHSAEFDHSARSIALLETPKSNVTEPGADGFIVFSDTATGEMTYRLWELKQHVGGSAVSATVGVAYNQLKQHAARYLAQLTAIHSKAPGPVGELCKQLVDFWIDCNTRAGVGIGVASATTPAPTKCFGTMGAHFPGFTQAGQLEGLLLAVEELTELARDVRGYLWTVL
ncbi:hypothetical protein JYB55_21780 [Mycolicibacterium septicum]|nr:hypothetical protein [Mycolicibacterium septicum]